MVDFKKGDIVELKAGGPRMTIDAVSSMNGIHCIWFRRAALSSAWFTPETLKLSSEEE